MMKRLRNAIHSYALTVKLPTKLTMLLMLFLMIPVLILSEVLFTGMRRAFISEQERVAALSLAGSRAHAEAVLASCCHASQVVVASGALQQGFDAYLGGGQPVSAIRRDHIDPVIWIAEANPHLLAVRAFVNDNRIREFPPVLYNFEHMKQQPWYTLPFPSNNTWELNLSGETRPFHEDNDEDSRGYAVLLHELRFEDGGTFGMLEVSTPMDVLFRDMYGLEADIWMGFVDATGSLHYDKGGITDQWRGMIGSAVYGGSEIGGGDRNTLLNLGTHTVLVSATPLPGLSGRLIRAVMLDNGLVRIGRVRFLFYAGLILFFLLCVFFMNRAVQSLLSRFYTLIDIAKEARRGNLNVTVPEMGQDEIGELASDLKETVDRIRGLLETSVSRELLVKTTEIQALQNQINSHFIYNVLESIKMMAEIEERYAISDAVTSLGELLRYSMRWVSSMVTLGEELGYIQDYISLLNLRYDFTIQLALEIPERFYRQKIPKMSLQPLVENAVQHGIEELDEDAVIRMKITEFDGYFEVEISDTGMGMDEEQLLLLHKKVYGLVKTENKRGGIGLRNVQERIQLCYGPEYGLRFYTKKDCFTKVVVKLPLSKEETDGTSADSRG